MPNYYYRDTNGIRHLMVSDTRPTNLEVLEDAARLGVEVEGILGTMSNGEIGFRKVNSVEGERKGYNHGINEENRRDFFPQRYGVELEYESPTETNLNEIAELLTEEGLCWADVKRDGSLSHRGYEVISEPVDTLDELYEFMEGTLKVAQSLGSTNKSPTAIHIHVSNYDNPVEYRYQQSQGVAVSAGFVHADRHFLH